MSAESASERLLQIVSNVDYSSKRVQAITALLLGSILGPVTVWGVTEVQKAASELERDSNYSSYQEPLPSQTEMYYDPRRINGLSNPSYHTVPYNRR